MATSIYFYARIVSHSLCKKFFFWFVFLPLFRKLIHFIVRLFSPPLWLKILSLAGSRFIFSPSRLPDSYILVSPLLESNYFSLVFFFPLSGSISLSHLSFFPFRLSGLVVTRTIVDTITSFFHAFHFLLTKVFLHFNVSRYFGFFPSLEFWLLVFL